jgi:cytochrome c-type biogenesis protein
VNVNGAVALVAGLLSFFSPCVLPLVPSFLIYIGGTAIHHYSDLSQKKDRKTILLHAIACGLLLIVMGLNMANLLKIPLLNREKIIPTHQKHVGLLGSFVVGVTFSLGWTPCIGPVLASILLISATGNSLLTGFHLLGLYSLGLAIPFFVAALLVSRLMDFMQRFGHIVRYTSIVLGILLVVLGLLLVTGYWLEIGKRVM